MKIRILKQTMLGGTVVRIEVVEASFPPQYLIGPGKAEQVIDEPPKKEKLSLNLNISCPPVKPKRRKPMLHNLGSKSYLGTLFANDSRTASANGTGFDPEGSNGAEGEAIIILASDAATPALPDLGCQVAGIF